MRLTESYWPATTELALLPTTCGGVLRDAARVVPEHIALIDAEGAPGARRRWSYRALLHAAEHTAQALLARCAAGSHVAVWAGNSPEWIILQFGLALAGMVMVTVNPAYRANELAYVLRQSRAYCFTRTIIAAWRCARWSTRAAGAARSHSISAWRSTIFRPSSPGTMDLPRCPRSPRRIPR